ncbi:MAG: hypothetical protein JXO22_12010 [Phycisphaerae bacterium]|nr:hypothetical protein [Phycisphaerae bacterium]
MMRWIAISGLLATLLIGALGCPFGTDQTTANPFVVLTEQQLIESNADTPGGGTSAGGGTAAQTVFRADMTVTFANNHPAADLDFNFIAWVSPGSIHTADDQDELWDSGYIQLSRTLDLGLAYSLPPGTFVFSPEGAPAATRVRLLATGGAVTEGEDETTGEAATESSFTLITPDVILVYLDPPDSCDSVAFEYSDEGDVLTSDPIDGVNGIFGGATTTGGFKTLAQVDVYQCDPFQPGVFLKPGGGGRAVNQYFEGEGVRFDFRSTPTAAGDFATVEFLSETTASTETESEEP